jgi:PBP4 family serine-type D-alanyl-D-alanine carboxypeptidase
MARQAVVIRLQLLLDGDSLSGCVSDGRRAAREFVGWLEAIGAQARGKWRPPPRRQGTQVPSTGVPATLAARNPARTVGTMRRTALPGVIGVALAATMAAPAQAAAPRELPPAIRAIMDLPRYQSASWSLYAADVRTGRPLYSLNASRRSLSGSTRKLMSVGLALRELGANARQRTTVHRRGRVDRGGALRGSLVLVGGGDLAFGGRRIDADTIQYTGLDHNDANALGSGELTPQDPLFALDRLAAQVRRSGIRRVTGEVAVDDRMFRPYRVPNGNLLITPVMLNENMVDVAALPTLPGRPAAVQTRPQTAALTIAGSIATGAAGSAASIALSGNGRVGCIGTPGCSATLGGSLPEDYRAPISGADMLVRTLRIEEPNAFMRTAFIEALRGAGVTVDAPVVAANPRTVLPRRFRYRASTRVAVHRSAPFAQTARLVLKVSLNLGANLSLSLHGLEHGARTVQAALAAERRVLIRRFGLDPRQFRFPTNGSGTPDSEASPKALVRLLRGMARSRAAKPFYDALPIMGRDGSLAHTGTTLASRGNVRAKPGTTILAGDDGESLELKAQNMAGYLTTRSGRRVAFALMVNDVGTVTDLETDVAAVFEDEARILDAVAAR